MGRKPEWGGAQDVREPPNAASACAVHGWTNGTERTDARESLTRKSSLDASGRPVARELAISQQFTSSCVAPASAVRSLCCAANRARPNPFRLPRPYIPATARSARRRARH